MELFYVTIILLLGTALGEETVSVSISNHQVDIGDDVQIIWKVRKTTDTTVLKIVKVVLYDDEDGQERREEQNILASEEAGVFTIPFSNSGRYKYNKDVVDDGYDIRLEIERVQPEDSGIFGLYIVLSQLTSTVLLDVFTKPEEVHFVNFTETDDMEFAEGETRTVRCMAMGGMPLPRLDISVGPVNYTKFFKHHESTVRLPDCYSSNMEESCILHPVTDSSTTAFDFRPDVSAHRQKLVCSAYHPKSDMPPKQTDVSVKMTYAPKFRCWKKHKVALHTENYKLNCTVRTSPELEEIYFEYPNNAGQIEKLYPGKMSSNNELEFMQLKQDQYEEVTNVTLKIKQVMERHYDQKFILKAKNDIGSNTTSLELVEEDYVRGSTNLVRAGILTSIVTLLSLRAP